MRGRGKEDRAWLITNVSAYNPPRGANEYRCSNGSELYVNFYQQGVRLSANVSLLFIHQASTNYHRFRRQFV